MNNKNIYYQLTVDETLESLDSKADGLNDKDARERLKLYGKNKLKIQNKTPLIFRLLKQVKDLMIIILIVSGLFSIYLQEYRDAIIVYSIVVINALIGFFQEYKAEKMMASLKVMVEAKAKVIRMGKVIEIDGADLVPGDIVVIEEGDAVPADLRVLQDNNLSTNDFALTGESNPTKKFTHEIKGAVPLGDRNNIAFMGTTVATGNGQGIVIATGMETEIGRIAHLSQVSTDGLSPLQKELNTVAKKLSFAALTIASLLFIVAILLDFGLKEAVLFALGMAVSVVPQGLPAQVSIALSLAAGRLAREKAIIKKLSAVETLGATHIICTDKTGTLTKNEMTVQKLTIGYQEFTISGLGYEPKGEILYNNKPLQAAELEKYKLVFETGSLASNAKINAPDEEHHSWYGIGDPTEAALITLALKAGVDTEKLSKECTELKEFTFDAVRKRMSSIRQCDGKIIVFVKGAPERIMENCNSYYDDGEIKPLTEEFKKFIEETDKTNAGEAMRNLALAYKEIDQYDPEAKMEDIEKDLIFLGVVSMIDPLREEVEEALQMALRANIRVIIITGDYPLTAEAIARKIDLAKYSHHDKEITVITGAELHKISDIELLHQLIHSNLIFARTSPDDKLRIVDLLKKAGEIVAVTGDGVNDSPALKKADIGVAMGKTGTEVAKESAEIILLDDSFATLVTAIKEGRTVFQNLKKNILSSLTSNGAELFAVLLSLAFGILYDFPLAILVVQILAIDLIGEMLPLTFLTWDPPQTEIMTEAPRNPNQHILNRKRLIDIIWSGFLMGGLGYLNFILFFQRAEIDPAGLSTDTITYMQATTLTYVSIVFTQWMNILSRRAGETNSAFTSYLFSNKRLLVGYAISLFLLLNISYNPWISHFFRTAPLSLIDWLFAATAALSFFLIREGYKFVSRWQLSQASNPPSKL